MSDELDKMTVLNNVYDVGVSLKIVFLVVGVFFLSYSLTIFWCK